MSHTGVPLGGIGQNVSDRLSALEAFCLGGPGFLTTPPQIFTGAGVPTDAALGTPPIGSVFLRNDGGAGTTLYVKTGVGAWTATATVAVAGADTQVQFNDGGSLAGNAALTFVKATGKLLATLMSAIFQETTAAKAGATDALPLGGFCPVTTAGVNAMTLATPSAGTDDGKRLSVVDTGGHAHTITTAANKIAPSHDTVTFNGTIGSFVVLVAYNGLWYVLGSSGVAFTEV